MPPSWSSALAGGSSSGHTPSSSARASSGRCDGRTRSFRWWSKVGYRKKWSCSISKCLFSSRIPPLRSVMSCSPSASARTVTAHSLKATGIGKRNLQNAARRASATTWDGTRAALSYERSPGFQAKFALSLFECPNHRGEVLFCVSLLGRPGEQRLHERAESQLHAQGAGLVEAVSDVLQHVLELEQGGEVPLEHGLSLESENGRVAGAAGGHLEERAGVDPGLLDGQHGLRERRGVDGAHRVGEELRELRVPAGPDVNDPLSHCLEERPRLPECRLLATHHDRERAVLGLGARA